MERDTSYTESQSSAKNRAIDAFKLAACCTATFGAALPVFIYGASSGNNQLAMAGSVVMLAAYYFGRLNLSEGIEEVNKIENNPKP